MTAALADVADADAVPLLEGVEEAKLAAAPVALKLAALVTIVLLAKITRPKKALIAAHHVRKTTITGNPKTVHVTRTKMSHPQWTMPRKAKVFPKQPLMSRTKPKLSTKNAPKPIANIP
ncbi:MAG TPA: hypothetical protein VM680_13750 [Verrucomicrobiae bacterium]|nr:hypothetical protein [Verrucomicrobiae bacterium]